MERYHVTSVQSCRSRRAGCWLLRPQSSASTALLPPPGLGECRHRLLRAATGYPCPVEPTCSRRRCSGMIHNSMPANDINGFYAGYLSAAAGEGVAIFVFRNGVLTGVDAGGFSYDGTLEETSEGNFAVVATIRIPPRA